MERHKKTYETYKVDQHDDDYKILNALLNIHHLIWTKKKNMNNKETSGREKLYIPILSKPNTFFMFYDDDANIVGGFSSTRRIGRWEGGGGGWLAPASGSVYIISRRFFLLMVVMVVGRIYY